MKAIIIYSGKGGVGKTTTTANIARLLAKQGNKVFIIDADINLLQQEINEGYIMLSDGRYLPPKEAVQQCYNAFGIRVGLGDNWEDIYDGWNKEMK